MHGKMESDMTYSKENFYSNLNGTTKAEIMLAVSPAPVSFILCKCFMMLLKTFHIENVLFSVLVEFVLFFVILLSSFTFLNDQIGNVITSEVLGIILIVWYLLQNSNKHRTDAKKSRSSLLQTPMAGKRLFISNSRVFLNIMTAISILAVDFKIFPRRFAKVETFGTGLMDIGVGSFVFVNAIVSPEARAKTSLSKGITGGVQAVLRSTKSCLPLILIGVLRVLSVKGVDYHEHVSEYGVHWNFFFTLAAVRIAVTACFTLIPHSFCGILGLVVALGYQYFLTNQGLQEFILHGADGNNSRDGLLDANREGLVSCIGYSALFMMCIPLGKRFLKARSTVGEWLKLLAFLTVLDVILWLFLAAVEAQVEPVSRRIANLAFITWILSFDILFVAMFLAAEIMIVVIESSVEEDTSQSHDDQLKILKNSILLEAVNRNQLLFFLAANLLTGAVNIYFDTIVQPPSRSFIILVGYLGILSSGALILHLMNMKVKL